MKLGEARLIRRGREEGREVAGGLDGGQGRRGRCWPGKKMNMKVAGIGQGERVCAAIDPSARKGVARTPQRPLHTQRTATRRDRAISCC